MFIPRKNCIKTEQRSMIYQFKKRYFSPIVKARKVIMTIMTTKTSSDIAHMTSRLDFFLMHVNPYSYANQSKQLSDTYFHIRISVLQPVGYIGIAVFAGGAVFACFLV